ncbi:penicillin-binding protein PBP3 [Acinetobacter sp. MD2]|uniref:penicillin-binding protein PBP3 n=1 Tax=Acinetobacter sp. MD2 TaxID=2600066 RepID=UPI002D1E63D3|nr:penicillin-binding protein PBP3 [Acinetobacter sp. MD2]MEB3766963.1 penicillin-binding protein PBP3 [Acinetobacter sp. MD2]
MAEKRMNQPRKAKPRVAAVTQKNEISFDQWRYTLLWTIVIVCFVTLIFRAFYVQVINKDFLQSKANALILRDEKIKAMRGMITDRNGVPLAISTPIMKIVMDPRDYFENKNLYDEMTAPLKPGERRKPKQKLPDKDFNLDELASLVGMDPNLLKKQMQAHPRSRYLVLKTEVPPQQADLILERNFQGVYTEKSYKRYYPQPQPNAQIVGLTNNDGIGVEGLEMKLNKALNGVDGLQTNIRDKSGNRVKDPDVIKPVQAGENFTLSIDSRLQYIMYRELTAAGVANNARSATAIAVDVKTGEILAMGSWPSYNPNDKASLSNKDAMRNRGAIDMFEPGSTMKPFTIAAALESGKYTTNTVINTSPGSMVIGGHLIRDTHDHGQLTLAGVIIKSSNVGAAKIALSLPKPTIPSFFKRVGFSQRSAVHFPGESAGLILPPKYWGVSEIGTMAYGYGLNATVLQLAQGYAMLANHGMEMPLSLYKVNQPEKGKQVLDPKIADQVLLMMEQVTLPGGTAIQAQIPGYRVAGKTGTAHKLNADRRGYSKTEYRALFAGVAPVSNPRIAMVVVVENPRGSYYGGTVSAPVFSRIMQESLRLLDVPLDKPLSVNKVTAGGEDD